LRQSALLCLFAATAIAQFTPFRSEAEVAEAIVKYPARLYDLRVKDPRQRRSQNLNVEAGRGLIYLAPVLRRAAQDQLSEVHCAEFTPAQQRSRS